MTSTSTGGKVKWFDSKKGFGFIKPDEGGPDILLHANVLLNFGRNSIADDTPITVSAIKTDRGLQATEILTIKEVDPATKTANLTDFADIDPEAMSATPAEPARVKWFDKGKGFGFANAFGSDADIFVHAEVLRAAGLTDLMSGEAIALRVIEGNRGLMACEVLPWETPIQPAVAAE